MNKTDKNSYLYKKYLEAYDPESPANIKKRKDKMAAKRKSWWESSWINFATMILALLTLVATIVFGLLK